MVVTEKGGPLDGYFLYDRALRELDHDTTYRLEKRCANLGMIDPQFLFYKYKSTQRQRFARCLTRSLSSRRTSTLYYSPRGSRRTRTRTASARSLAHKLARSGLRVRTSAGTRSIGIAGMRERACISTMTPCRRSRTSTRAPRRSGHCGLGARVKSKDGSLCESLSSFHAFLMEAS